MIGNNSCFNTFIEELPTIKEFHTRGEKVYNFLQKSFRGEVDKLFQNDIKDLSPFGEIVFPFHKMGNVDTTNLFDLDEIIIFSFYWQARSRYKNVADLGANVGLHSILLSKSGFNVKSYEPDSWHFSILEENIKNNSCKNIELFNCAVSDEVGEVEFIRVLGNTTSSHISGDKNPYGELETVVVDTVDFKSVIKWADFLKIDVEGHEVVLVTSTTKDDWNDSDAMIEISNEDNAQKVFEFFNSIDVDMYSQKKSWEKVTELPDVPTSYKEGSLFVSNNGSPFSTEQ